MNIYDVIEMIKLGEGWTIDFKEMFQKPSSLALPIVAFSNHEGGTILIGVNDKGQVVGVNPTHEERDNVLRAGRDGCRPPITNLDIQEFVIDGKTVVAVSVPAAKDEIYATSDGRYLIRRNSENISTDWRQLQQLMSARAKGWFEDQVCSGATYDDLDSALVQRYLKAREAKFQTKIEMPVEDILKSRHCIVEKDGKLMPTHAGVILFGKEPRRFLSMDYATVVKFKGTDQAEGYTDRKDFEGCSVDLINQILKWVDDRMYRGGRIPKSSPIREDILQFYPPTVREIVVNGVAHRDYANMGSRILVSMFDDRLEVQSPGGLPAGITPQNIRHAQFSRNPYVLMTLMEWGFGEQLGHGYDKIYRELEREHYQLPKLEDTAGSFIVTLYAKDVEKALSTPEQRPQAPELNKRQHRALAFLKKHQKMTLSDYLKINPKTPARTAYEDLAGMVEKGVVKATGSKKGRRYVLSAT